MEDEPLKHCEDCDLFYLGEHDCDEYQKMMKERIESGNLKLVKVFEWSKDEPPESITDNLFGKGTF